MYSKPDSFWASSSFFIQKLMANCPLWPYLTPGMLTWLPWPSLQRMAFSKRTSGTQSTPIATPLCFWAGHELTSPPVRGKNATGRGTFAEASGGKMPPIGSGTHLPWSLGSRPVGTGSLAILERILWGMQIIPVPHLVGDSKTSQAWNFPSFVS